MLSTPAAAWLTRDAGTLRADVARLRGAGGLVSRSGKPKTKVMEDVWLGSLLFRDPPPQPLSFVTLFGGLGLISDDWGLRTTRQALLTHLKAKSLPRLLTLYAYTRQHHCPAPVSRFTCNKGCASFAGKYAGAEEDPNCKGIHASCKALPPCRAGAQAEARNCRFGEPAGTDTPGRAACCLGKACVDKVWTCSRMDCPRAPCRRRVRSSTRAADCSACCQASRLQPRLGPGGGGSRK